MKGLNSTISPELKDFLKSHIQDMKDLKEFNLTKESSFSQTFYGWDYILYKQSIKDSRYVLYVNITGSDDIDLNILKSHLRMLTQYNPNPYNRKSKSNLKINLICEMMLNCILKNEVADHHVLKRMELHEFDNPSCNNLNFYKAFVCTFGQHILYELLHDKGNKLFMENSAYQKLMLIYHVSKNHDDLTKLLFALEKPHINKFVMRKDYWFLDPVKSYKNLPVGLTPGEQYFYEEHQKIQLAWQFANQLCELKTQAA